MVSVEEFPISTANDIPGFRIVETKGFIYGLTVRSRGAGGQIGAGIKSIFGGEIKQYVTMMEESPETKHCIGRLIMQRNWVQTVL